jgi:hypothetical protein
VTPIAEMIAASSKEIAAGLGVRVAAGAAA